MSCRVWSGWVWQGLAVSCRVWSGWVWHGGPVGGGSGCLDYIKRVFFLFPIGDRLGRLGWICNGDAIKNAIDMFRARIKLFYCFTKHKSS